MPDITLEILPFDTVGASAAAVAAANAAIGPVIVAAEADIAAAIAASEAATAAAVASAEADIDAAVALSTAATAAANAAAALAAAATNNACDLTFRMEGKPYASEIIADVIFARAATFPVALAGSQFKADIAATASTVLSVKKNAVEWGTITIAIGATIATFASAAGSAIVTGDRVQIIAPASPDATLANFVGTLKGIFS